MYNLIIFSIIFLIIFIILIMLFINKNYEKFASKNIAMVVVSCDNNALAQIYTPVESENIDNCNPIK